MANYAMWRAAADKGETRRVTWICGDQPILVEEVVDTTRQAVRPSELDYLSFTGGVDPEREIWAAANQFPLDPAAHRLLLIRRAEKVTQWAALEHWLASSRRFPNTYLVFVSGEDDFPYHYTDGKRAGLKPHVELIKTRGRIVRCAMPNDIDLLAWVRRRAPSLDEETADYLLRRCGGDLLSVAAVAGKLAVLSGTPGRASIDALCQENPSRSFVDHLLAVDKRQALLAAQRLTDRELPKLLATLDSRLDLLGELWRASRAGLSARDVQGQPMFLVRQYLPIARHYDPNRCVYRRRVLAVCDDAARQGVKTGLVEALVALW